MTNGDEQIWQELFKKTETGEITWRHTKSKSGYKEFMTFETVLDGKKFTLRLGLIKCAGGGGAAMGFEHVFLEITNKDGTDMEIVKNSRVWHMFQRTIAGKLYNYLSKQVKKQRKELIELKKSEVSKLI